ncbi:MAG: hypothetical protein ACHQX3_00995 [Nitrospirales bacterium]|jgi:hypothetical protein
MESNERDYDGCRLTTLTVNELIELLQERVELDPANGEMGVLFAVDYGDHMHTEQALGVEGRIEEVGITKSAYSHSGFATVTGDDIYDDDSGEIVDAEPEQKFLVIR